MMPNNMGMQGSYTPNQGDYNTNSYKMMPTSYPSYTSNMYQQSNQTSIALFHIPTDATNSLYVDGVPNDAS